MEMSVLPTALVGVVLGEGGSGGALGIGVADRLLMLAFAYYSVISPEGCAAILWRSGEKVEEAASALKLGANELLRVGLIDGIVEEPLGGAHRDPEKMAGTLKEALLDNMRQLSKLSVEEMLNQRKEKYRLMGVFMESSREVDQAKIRLKSRACGE
jgi:acetyl-CoA carboxylase carboxyl transferase subunit alpha